MRAGACWFPPMLRGMSAQVSPPSTATAFGHSESNKRVTFEFEDRAAPLPDGYRCRATRITTDG